MYHVAGISGSKGLSLLLVKQMEEGENDRRNKDVLTPEKTPLP